MRRFEVIEQRGKLDKMTDIINLKNVSKAMCVISALLTVVAIKGGYPTDVELIAAGIFWVATSIFYFALVLQDIKDQEKS